jgi:hypothetical protein
MICVCVPNDEKRIPVTKANLESKRARSTFLRRSVKCSNKLPERAQRHIVRFVLI